jgi:hypothetical protein
MASSIKKILHNLSALEYEIQLCKANKMSEIILATTYLPIDHNNSKGQIQWKHLTSLYSHQEK